MDGDGDDVDGDDVDYKHHLRKKDLEWTVIVMSLMMMVGTVWMVLVMTLMMAMITVVVISKDDNDYKHNPMRSSQQGDSSVVQTCSSPVSDISLMTVMVMMLMMMMMLITNTI